MPEITKSWADFMTATARSEQFKVWSREIGKENEEPKVRFVIATSQFAFKGESTKKEFGERLDWCKTTAGVVVQLADEPFIATDRLYNP